MRAEERERCLGLKAEQAVGEVAHIVEPLKSTEGQDTMLAALRDNLGQIWGRTVVLVATEFGRTAAVKGLESSRSGSKQT